MYSALDIQCSSINILTHNTITHMHRELINFVLHKIAEHSSDCPEMSTNNFNR